MRSTLVLLLLVRRLWLLLVLLLLVALRFAEVVMAERARGVGAAHNVSGYGPGVWPTDDGRCIGMGLPWMSPVDWRWGAVGGRQPGMAAARRGAELLHGPVGDPWRHYVRRAVVLGSRPPARARPERLAS